MKSVDWLVVAVYLAGMVLLAYRLGLGQRTRADYYLGGRSLGNLSLASSTIATHSRCSRNS